LATELQREKATLRAGQPVAAAEPVKSSVPQTSE